MKNMLEVKIVGLARLNDGFKNIVLYFDNFADKTVKELIYSTEFGDVESLFGFSDLDIIEIDITDERVAIAKAYLDSSNDLEAVVFLKDGVLMISDLTYFSAYTYIKLVQTPYTSLVESHTYEEEESMSIINEDFRL